MVSLLISLALLYATGAGFGIWYKLDNPEKPIRWIDALNPMKWLSIAISAWLIHMVPPHIVEQLCLRLYDNECGNICVKQGYCHDCGCAMPMKAFDPMASCSRGNWGPMIMDKKKYAEFRKQFPVTITINHGKH